MLKIKLFSQLFTFSFCTSIIFLAELIEITCDQLFKWEWFIWLGIQIALFWRSIKKSIFTIPKKSIWSVWHTWLCNIVCPGVCLGSIWGRTSLCCLLHVFYSFPFPSRHQTPFSPRQYTVTYSSSLCETRAAFGVPCILELSLSFQIFSAHFKDSLRKSV